jgi:homocysteine S-methyltransferase
MSKYRNSLPQLSGAFFLTDGGLETTLVFHQGIDLPHFSAIDMMRGEDSVASLRDYYRQYAEIARSVSAGFIFESPTWRSSPDWAPKLGLTDAEMIDLNRRSIELGEEIRGEFETSEMPVVISGCIGPRGDGYSPDSLMTADEAAEYHSTQANTFATTEADMIAAITMNYVNEAVGVANASKAAGMPCAISFTVETDGRLPTGESLKEAIETTDGKTGSYPAYYLINCAHTTHFADVLNDEPWVKRIRGVRANASKKSHAELDESTELDIGDPAAFGREHGDIVAKCPHINVLGGCCGTDTRHVKELAQVRS